MKHRVFQSHRGKMNTVYEILAMFHPVYCWNAFLGNFTLKAHDVRLNFVYTLCTWSVLLQYMHIYIFTYLRRISIRKRHKDKNI